MQCKKCPLLNVPEIYRVIYDYSIETECLAKCKKELFSENVMCLGSEICKRINWDGLKKWITDNPKRAKEIYDEWKQRHQ